MDKSHTDDSVFQKMLADARGGDEVAIGALLNEYRDYLLLIANQQMDRKVQGKVGGSDIVQESMLSAQQGFSRFKGETPEQLMAWLRQILINDVYETGRRYRQAAKRNVDREVGVPHGSVTGAPLIDPHGTPSTHALIEEETRNLRDAMSRLPDDYRRILELRNWEQLSFEEIGKRMDRSADAARKVWTRAILNLQQLMK